MQKFDKSAPATRGKRLIEEISHAMKGNIGGANIQDVFNDPEWISSFESNWNKYAEGDDWKTLFNP